MSCCRTFKCTPNRTKRVFGGTADPNGRQDGPPYSIYNQVDGTGALLRTWIKTTALGTNTGWQ